jgi:uncharacterized cupredoxin-like copper-binding protein
MRRTIFIPAAFVMAAIAAGGASAHRAQPAGSQVDGKATLLATVKVAAKEFKFTLSAKTAKRGVVVFKVTNVGALQHDFEISGRKTKLLSHGQSDTLRVTFLRKGTYPYKCTVPGHATQGMKGVFTIT